MNGKSHISWADDPFFVNEMPEMQIKDSSKVFVDASKTTSLKVSFLV